MVAAGFAPAAQGQKEERMLAKPTPEQVEWHDMEIEMFLCLDPCTWQDKEYDDHSTPLAEINPSKLDTDQWVAVAKSMGAKQIIFVAKHVGGFCWWQTETTDYGVRQIPWRDGKGDVVADLAESCRKGGIQLGIYLSPADDKHGASVGGRCKKPEEQEAYNQVYRRQLTELLSRYGEVSEVWFDGSLVVEVGDILKKHAPKAMVFQGPHATIRWVGNEEGVAPYPAWNAVSTADPSRIGVQTAADGDPDGDKWLPNECDGRIRSTWFWNTKNADTLKSVDALMDMYCKSVGRGAVLLLNNTPDTTGLIPEADAKRSAEFGAEIRRRFGKSLAETTGRGDIVEINFGRPTRIDHVVTMEDIRDGERVREYVIEGMIDGAWREITTGTAIGHKKIDLFEPAAVAKVRLRVTKLAAEPLIRKLAAYNVSGRNVDAEGRPLIRKIGTIECDLVEVSPFVLRDRVYRVEWVRTTYKGNKTGKNYLHIVDRETGEEISAFGEGHAFPCAYVEDDTVYVLGTQVEGSWQSQRVTMFTSRDLKNWDSRTALDLPGYGICNTSLCKADDRYVMMFEIHLPKEETGVAFTARFATSKDLEHWKVTPPECNYAKDRYTAPHCLRYLDGWFYDFYLEARNGYEQCVVRSKDFIHWELSPLNPVLRASDEDRGIANPKLTKEERGRIATAQNLNNSDIDLCEYRGKLVINYSWGNQQGVEHLAEAVYDGTLEEFLRGWFPGQ
jgi:alpha-L-fucosidase